PHRTRKATKYGPNPTFSEQNGSRLSSCEKRSMKEQVRRGDLNSGPQDAAKRRVARFHAGEKPFLQAASHLFNARNVEIP
ncbi:MAG TPA: hypothetical protein PK971_08240, partial [Saprospiraceae bacterium]|nr:hypothetical protein [Saprospiraceae bacterium]